jgi:two-component system, sensor histidine kinase YesM
MINYFNRKLKLNKIRRKLLIYFIFTTILMGIACFYTYYNAHSLTKGMNSIFMNNNYLNDINNNVISVQSSLESYLLTNHSDSLKEYYRNSTKLKYSGEAVKIHIYSTDSGLLLEDIGNMIYTYLDEADAAVNAKRGRDINGYVQHYTEASHVFSYINILINKLTIGQFQENTKAYTLISARLNFIQIINLILILGIVAFNIIFILRVTFKTTQPIISLSNSAIEISKGRYDVEAVKVHSDDEIGVMANAFNQMTESIKNQVSALKESAKLEVRFKEQEMQYLIMKNHLKETEIQALQSQINPHFIFNTLNAGVQLAMMEGADRTCLFVECFANLFRYNLRKMDMPVTLKDEIENITNYIFLLKVRYTDRILFIQEIDDSVTHVRMPCMVLQPLVENAFIHGISEMESGGRITLRVFKQDEFIVIEIEDNGKGMSEDKICLITDSSDDSDSLKDNVPTGHTTGIGTKNVIKRLKYFFNSEDVFNIYSNNPGGTRIIIKIKPL